MSSPRFIVSFFKHPGRPSRFSPFPCPAAFAGRQEQAARFLRPRARYLAAARARSAASRTWRSAGAVRVEARCV